MKIPKLECVAMGALGAFLVWVAVECVRMEVAEQSSARERHLRVLLSNCAFKAHHPGTYIDGNAFEDWKIVREECK